MFNLQTRSLFIDIRIPVGAKRAFAGCRSLSDLSIDDLCLFSQRHAFAGYSVVSPDLPSKASPHNQSPPVCVRHHAIDWNFVGTPRPRPNKWRIEMAPNGNVWKEWGWPTDDFGQHVYVQPARPESLAVTYQVDSNLYALKNSVLYFVFIGGRSIYTLLSLCRVGPSWVHMSYGPSQSLHQGTWRGGSVYHMDGARLLHFGVSNPGSQTRSSWSLETISTTYTIALLHCCRVMGQRHRLLHHRLGLSSAR